MTGGATAADMRACTDMFSWHAELHTPRQPAAGGARRITEAGHPGLAAQFQVPRDGACTST